jgi:hypothetical protein
VNIDDGVANVYNGSAKIYFGGVGIYNGTEIEMVEICTDKQDCALKVISGVNTYNFPLPYCPKVSPALRRQ